VAVVTGAARGIGAATVARLLAEGWSVVAVDRVADDPAVPYPMARPEDLEKVVAAAPDRVIGLTGDVRRQTDMDAAVARATQAFGRLDAVVAAAGVIAGGVPLWETPEDRWNALFETNVVGVRRLVEAAVPILLAAEPPRRGRVVAVASAAGLLGLRRLAAYTASKHAVIGLMKGLAADLAGTGITANAVCPGSTRTPMLDESARLYGLESAEAFGGQQLVERLLEPEEPAALIAWLCSEESGAVTGAALAVDGGLSTS
jgi:SDR family mycofactocin-dependent oxidoreductase